MVEKSQDKEMDKSVAIGNVENNSEKVFDPFQHNQPKNKISILLDSSIASMKDILHYALRPRHFVSCILLYSDTK